MTFTLLIASIICNVYLLDQVRFQRKQLKYKDDDIQYWKIISKKARHQYDLMVKWNNSWR